MPWRESCRMSERAKFVLEAQQGLFTVSELCARYGISRKTGYKWLERFDRGGVAWLADGSRAPGRCPHATAAELVARIERARQERPYWGPRKLRAWLSRRDPSVKWPAVSTIGAVLKRAGLVEDRRRRRARQTVWSRPSTVADAPNRVWTTDFKGEYRLRNGRMCYPLTLMDSYSRYLLVCEGLGGTSSEAVRRQFDQAFRTYGLPDVIQSDNGSPFASVALQGLSRLAVGWIKLGIRLERSRPAHPQDNPRHERMHRTLKKEATTPTPWDERDQQQKFEAFRQEYNQERPHESLKDRTPSELYRCSSRAMPNEVPEPEYPKSFERRIVGKQGMVKWRRRRFHLTQTLATEVVGFEPIDDGIWSVWFGPILLGRFDEVRFSFVEGAGQNGSRVNKVSPMLPV
jgi:transposase InsO family protein